jgi:hypothetical protein
MTAIIKQAQCLMDMAVQHCGDATGLFEIAKLNEISMTKEMAIGTEIKIPEAVNEEIKQWFIDNGYIVATDNPMPAEPVIMEGIGYWRINLDFIVS